MAGNAGGTVSGQKQGGKNPQQRGLSRPICSEQRNGFAWHHLQIWAEFYEARFEVPRVGDADTFAYYLEAKYKFTPQLFGALRWNQQFFNTIDNPSGPDLRWGNNLGRIDFAGAYRFNTHLQLKLQYSYQHETTGPGDTNHIFAAQFTVRF